VRVGVKEGRGVRGVSIHIARGKIGA
jgi:hypothetical protein